MDKQQLQKKQLEIINLVKGFCTEKLDEEYFKLSEKLIQKLGRKRNVPFETGQSQIWAAAVIHAIGTINFLFDKSFQPYVTIDEIINFFGTKKSTTCSKSKQIRDMLKLQMWDSEFSTNKMIRSGNPFASYVMVDGLLVPLNSLFK